MTIRAYTVYEAAVAIAAVAASGVVAEFTTDPTLDQPAGVTVKSGLLRLEVILTTAVATQLNLVQTNARGLVPATTTVGTKISTTGGGFAFGAVPNMSRIITAWGTPPTVTATVLRRDSLTVAAGTRFSFVWEWPEENPLSVNLDRGIFANTGLCLVNANGAGATAAMLLNMRWMEYNGAAIPN